MMNRHFQLIATVLLAICGETWGQEKFNINGRVISSLTREPVGYATVSVTGATKYYTIADSTGNFQINDVPAGIFSLTASSVGYVTTVTPQYMILSTTPFITIEMDDDVAMLSSVTVRSTVLERVMDSGIGKQIIGTADIEKIPGGNRDISRVIRSYPGIGYSPTGYRNDLIVRGGSPAENAFFIDGIEIPNINHFSTQGASGGPVGILNADLIEQVEFYTGSLPVDKGSVLSSVMDIKLKDGNLYKNTYKGTIGAAEAGISGRGHIGSRTTYIYSLRQSYLQMMFKLLKLPFLPNYIDGQFKVKHRISDKDEIMVMALGGIDKMKLNTSLKSEQARYMLSYLPIVGQKSFTMGTAYTHYGNKSRTNISLSYNKLDNKLRKYTDNDESSEDNLMYRIKSKEEKATIRGERRQYLGRFNLMTGVQCSYINYAMDSYERGYMNIQENRYMTDLDFMNYSVYASANYESYNKKFNVKAGIRADGADFSPETKRIYDNLSPRFQISYALWERLTVNGNIGFYHQLPPLTSLGYKIGGIYVNKGLEYMRVLETSTGLKWNALDNLVVSLEGFYKLYSKMPLCIRDSIPLACKGNDYGIVGNEPLQSTGEGRAYGLELSGRWIIAGKLNILGCATLFRSEYKIRNKYIPSAWDNRIIINCAGVYNLKRNWSIGGKLSYIGGAPYTPYDEWKSSIKDAWDTQGKPYYDYKRYNTCRLDPFMQIDIRIDKNWIFDKWMLGAYIDFQNITSSKLKMPDALVSTGEIENPSAAGAEKRYKMKWLAQESGSFIPGIGLTVEF